MKEKRETKEILTKDNIRIDLNSYVKSEFCDCFLWVFDAIILFGVGSFLISYLTEKIAIFYLGMSVPSIFFSYRLYVFIFKKYLVKKDRFIIVSDKFNGFGRALSLSSHSLVTASYMCFNCYDNFFIGTKLYTWCTMYNNYYKILKDRSNCGDEFYLVMFDNKKHQPLAVYNKKFFELGETINGYDA